MFNLRRSLQFPFADDEDDDIMSTNSTWFSQPQTTAIQINVELPTNNTNDESSLATNPLLPSHASPLSAGYDVKAAATVTIQPKSCMAIPTGITIKNIGDMENGEQPACVLLLKERSSWTMNPATCMLILRAGVIDADFRGHIRVVMTNVGDVPVSVGAGTKIAQIVVTPIIQVYWHDNRISNEYGESHTERGNRGFGGMDGESLFLETNSIATDTSDVPYPTRFCELLAKAADPAAVALEPTEI